MSNDQWKIGLGECDCDDAVCTTVKGDRSLHSHKLGNCHHPDGTHHRIHSSKEKIHCPKCNGGLKPALNCHVHSKSCCTKCEWGR